MFRVSLITLAALVLGGVAEAQIDLTPVTQEYVAEGITYKRLFFKDGDQRVVYEPPVQWTYRSLAADKIQLVPPKVSFAEGVIHATKLAVPRPLDEAAVAEFRQRVLAAVPPGALDVKLVEELQNAVTPSGNPSYEVTISYQALGQPFLRSGLIANVGGTQLQLQMTAPKAEFEPLRLVFRASIMSWHVEAPEPAAVAAR
jgi:hypothetical protein